jgi:hypothetical protein
MVTMGWEQLVAGVGAGTAVGSSEAGTLLGPDTVRRLACDAGVIPVVLGGSSEVLDVGRTMRLVPPGLVKALWLRDRHCTFPGCAMPAQWCDAHHVVHWLDGGATSMANSALVCTRHHTVVHRDRLTASVTAAGVAWDRVPGSYDRHLTQCRPPGWRAHDNAEPAA